jgi:hypothetical protein
MLLARYFLAEYVPGYAPLSQVASAYTDWKKITVSPSAQVTTEWLRSDLGQLCTFRGKYHLAWAVPMSDVSYWVPSAAIHSFLMFAPFFVMKSNMIIQGIASYIILFLKNLIATCNINFVVVSYFMFVDPSCSL